MSLQTRDRDFESFDGVRMAWTEAGPEDGRPLVLLHGLFSNANVNWLKFGTAARIADAGLRVIMPDFRGHGKSAAPTDAAAYPADVLADDVLALIDHLGLTDYDLGGYSLGGRQTLRAVIESVNVSERPIDPRAYPFTDDYAPIEALIDGMIAEQVAP